MNLPARLALPERLKPHLSMDTETGEVVSRLREEDIERIAQRVFELIKEEAEKIDGTSGAVGID